MSDLLGYSVVPQRLVENQLLSGGVFNTTNVIKTGNGVNGVPAFIPIDVRSRGASSEVCCQDKKVMEYTIEHQKQS